MRYTCHIQNSRASCLISAATFTVHSVRTWFAWSCLHKGSTVATANLGYKNLIWRATLLCSPGSLQRVRKSCYVSSSIIWCIIYNNFNLTCKINFENVLWIQLKAILGKVKEFLNKLPASFLSYRYKKRSQSLIFDTITCTSSILNRLVLIILSN
jgi:hypothetical protein